MMEQIKVNRLNSLFEKMVANNANVIERKELNNLYQEYIDDGRGESRRSSSINHEHKVAINS